MKFNKSAESDHYYVGFDSDLFAGNIVKLKSRNGYIFKSHLCYFDETDLDQISAKIKELDKQLGIDTTSTFTSIEDR